MAEDILRNVGLQLQLKERWRSLKASPGKIPTSSPAANILELIALLNEKAEGQHNHQILLYLQQSIEKFVR